jgi:NADH-ubiquinone oxidoreductase chain 5
MYLLSIFLSFIGSSFAGLFGKHIGSWGSARITTSCLFLSFIISLLLFYEVALSGSPVYLVLISWIDTEILNVNWGFMFDSLTVVMFLVVTFISFLVHLYSMEYMSHDPHLTRFMSYLSLFTFFMLVLVSADNFVQMFVGWEGVGLCSYLLINFWFTRIQANKAAIKAMLINRIGDFSLVIGILILYVNFKSVDYSSIAVLIPFFKNKSINLFNFDVHMLSAVGLFLFIGAVGKSAQIGLHSWLPDAMEGPTPVSALIHAATMVTAGVFIIARTSFLYEYIFGILEIIIVVGALTSFLASSIGLVQNDLKRVIAYSTCSQLGYMVFACGLSNYSVGIFHLTNHAFFKALLFLSAGSVIHSINDEQDMRKMGGLKNMLPFTYVTMACGSLALIGFPFLTGFYSKDLILEAAYSKYSLSGYFSYFLGTTGAFFTAFYSARLISLTFLVRPNGYKKIISYSMDSGFIIKFVLGLLAIPSVFIGYYSKDMLVGVGTSFFGNAVYTNPSLFNAFDAEFIPLFYKVLPINCSLLGFISALYVYSFLSEILFFMKSLKLFQKIYVFLNKKWFFDKIYNEYFSQFFFKFGYTISYKFIDRGVFELLGPTGLSFGTLRLGSILHKSQTNSLYHITLTVIFAITLLFFVESFRQIFTQSELFLNRLNEYSSSLSYIFCAVTDILGFDLLLINFIAVILLVKNEQSKN